MTKHREHEPAEVPTAKQAGEEHVRDNWTWTKPWVWTDRMLTALVNGVKGGQWFSLIDKVYKEETLHSAACWVTERKNKAAGVDHVTPEMFERRLPEKRPAVARRTSRRNVPTATRSPHRNPQAGQPPDATSGNPHDSRPRRPNGASRRDRTDLRAGLCRAQLRLSSWTRMQRRVATRRCTAEGWLRVRR